MTVCKNIYKSITNSEEKYGTMKYDKKMILEVALCRSALLLPTNAKRKGSSGL